ncbi:dihydroorotase [Marinihelvus fidelis]|uniref:Dihydroorotase n=1 Tax=Marinihelvus fidelis TaxID=2613842 RepID=A0A5N0TAQ3_9GAMM|nr:dihydroorotase [Marinihelvus fidelis]KAA9132095.1 dihydroorotase [Marinihelvus fidelis]
MSDITLITNARLVNEGEIFESDLLIRNGRIETIASQISAPEGATVVDAAGRHLLPGMIDDQVHFREPGMTHKANIHTESRAAIAGGVTSFMDMPNTKPPCVNAAELANKRAIAAKSAAANWGFYFGATNDNIEDIRSMDTSLVCGLKIFMGASTGNMLVDDDDTLAAIFRDCRVPISTHCESTPMIQANLEKALEKYGDDIPVEEHPYIRSEAACYASSEKAVALAKEHGARLHVLHLTTARELELFEPGPMAGKQITAETCIHFLHFSADDYPTLGNLIKCNPAIKMRSDRDGLLAGVREGRIDILATDHAPHTLEEKALTDYRKAPSGLPLVQDVLLASLELAHQGHLDLAEVITKIAHNPAIRFEVENRGFLREGYAADLVLVDLDTPTTISRDRVLSKVGWSPFEGRTFGSSINSVWINGALAFDGEKVIEHGAAQPLTYTR